MDSKAIFENGDFYENNQRRAGVFSRIKRNAGVQARNVGRAGKELYSNITADPEGVGYGLQESALIALLGSPAKAHFLKKQLENIKNLRFSGFERSRFGNGNNYDQYYNDQEEDYNPDDVDDNFDPSAGSGSTIGGVKPKKKRGPGRPSNAEKRMEEIRNKNKELKETYNSSIKQRVYLRDEHGRFTSSLHSRLKENNGLQPSAMDDGVHNTTGSTGGISSIKQTVKVKAGDKTYTSKELSRRDVDFITYLSKSINARLSGLSDEKNSGAKMFKFMNSMMGGFGSSLIFALPTFGVGILRVSQLKSALPDPKRVGVLNSINATLGMIYASMRSSMADSNRLLYALVNINKTGFGIDINVKKPVDASLTYSEAFGNLLAGVTTGARKFVSLPFRAMGNMATRAMGFGRKGLEDEDNYFGPGLANHMRIGQYGRVGGGIGGSTSGKYPTVDDGQGRYYRRKSFKEWGSEKLLDPVKKLGMAAGASVVVPASFLTAGKALELMSGNTNAVGELGSGLYNMVPDLSGAMSGVSLGGISQGVSAAGGATQSLLGNIGGGLSGVGGGMIDIMNAMGGVPTPLLLAGLLGGAFLGRRVLKSKKVSNFLGKASNIKTNILRKLGVEVDVGQLPEGTMERDQFYNSQGYGGGTVDISKIEKLLEEIRDCVCEDYSGTSGKSSNCPGCGPSSSSSNTPLLSYHGTSSSGQSTSVNSTNAQSGVGQGGLITNIAQSLFGGNTRMSTWTKRFLPSLPAKLQNLQLSNSALQTPYVGIMGALSAIGFRLQQQTEILSRTGMNQPDKGFFGGIKDFLQFTLPMILTTGIATVSKIAVAAAVAEVVSKLTPFQNGSQVASAAWKTYKAGSSLVRGGADIAYSSAKTLFKGAIPAIKGVANFAKSLKPTNLAHRIANVGIDLITSGSARQIVKGAGRATGSVIKAAGKGGAKAVGKGALKVVGKKIPLVGLPVGVGLGIYRAFHGDWMGAGMEVASGAIGAIPTPLTIGASFGIDAAIIARDLHNSGFFSKEDSDVIGTVVGSLPEAEREGFLARLNNSSLTEGDLAAAQEILSERAGQQVELPKSLAERSQIFLEGIYNSSKDTISTNAPKVIDSLSNTYNDVVEKTSSGYKKYSPYIKDKASNVWGSITTPSVNSENMMRSVESKLPPIGLDDLNVVSPSGSVNPDYSAPPGPRQQSKNKVNTTDVLKYSEFVNKHGFNKIALATNKNNELLFIRKIIQHMEKEGFLGFLFGENHYKRMMKVLATDINKKNKNKRGQESFFQRGSNYVKDLFGWGNSEDNKPKNKNKETPFVPIVNDFKLSPSERWGNVDPTLLNEIEATANRLGLDPNHLAAVIDFETGGTFSSSVKNPGSSATGLIQFMKSTAKELGTSTKELSNMSEIEQMKYVEKYLAKRQRETGNPLNSIEDLYMSVLNPASVNKSNDSVIWSAGSEQYRVNRGLDLDKDGHITKYEASSKVKDRHTPGFFESRQMDIASVYDNPNVPAPSNLNDQLNGIEAPPEKFEIYEYSSKNTPTPSDVEKSVFEMMQIPLSANQMIADSVNRASENILKVGQETIQQNSNIASTMAASNTSNNSNATNNVGDTNQRGSSFDEFMVSYGEIIDILIGVDA